MPVLALFRIVSAFQASGGELQCSHLDFLRTNQSLCAESHLKYVQSIDELLY